MNTITFYIGILPKDRVEFFNLFKSFNESNEMSILDEYNDPYGYYTFVIHGTWEDYNKFLHGPAIFKSVEHFEE